MAETLAERVAEIIPHYSMLEPGDRVGVAVSGGADSAVLLHILYGLSSGLKLSLVVLHMNHQLRGAESDADELFVRSLADSLGLEFAGERSTIPPGNLEQEARRLRHDFFARARVLHRLSRVALGHTRSDQAETVLFRLLRGSGLTGLAAMRPVTADGLIRPLLTTSRREVREWAEAEGIAWREDSSNGNLEFARNRLRNKTLPSLVADYNPDLEGALAGTAALAQAEEDYWQQQIEQLHSDFAKRTRLGSIFQIADLARLHLAVRRRLIRRALSEIRPQALRGLDFEHVEAVLGLCYSTKGHERAVVAGADALRSFGSLLLSPAGRLSAEPRDYLVNLRIDENHLLPFDEGNIYVGRVKRGGELYDNFKKDKELGVEWADLDPGALAGQALFARNWEPGDQLHRPGHESAEKIKELFQEQRVRLWERRHWPVVVCGKEIVWARKFGTSALFLASGKDSETVHLEYRADG